MSKRFGEIAIELGIATPEQVAAALAVQAEQERSGRPRSRIGELLKQPCSLNDEQIDRVLARLGVPPRPDAPASTGMTSASAGLAAAWLALEPGQKLGHFSVRRFHARGGLGQVWVVYDELLGREVALKVMRPELESNAQARQRFLNEAQLAGQLEHPHIVPVYEMGLTPEGRPYYAMKFVPGETLTDSIRRYHARPPHDPDASLEWRKLLEAFVGVCQAMAYAHEHGVIHRDLKPGNVMWGEYGEALVLDWGLAKRVEGGGPKAESQLRADEAGRSVTQSDTRSSVDEQAGDVSTEPEAGGQPSTPPDAVITRAGDVLGTLPFMPPEQAAGDIARVDARSDIYSLGAVLYTILTNRRPFTETDKARLLVQVLEQSPPRPRQINGRAPRPLEAICLKAMARARADRYASAKELGQDVQRWLADEPVSCYRDPSYHRAWRWAQRHRTATAAVAAALVVLGASLGIVAAYTHERTRTARDRVEALRTDAHQLLAARQERAALDKLLAARVVLESFPNLAVLARDVDAELTGIQGPIEARERLAQFKRLASRALALQPSPGVGQSRLGEASKFIEACEQAFAGFHVLYQEDWSDAPEADNLDPTEKERLLEYVETLSTAYLDAQRVSAIRGTATAGLGLQICKSMEASSFLPRVFEVDPDSPADRAGIRVDDKIIEIDGVQAGTLTDNEQVFNRLIGEPNTEIRLTVLHKGADEPAHVRIRRNSEGRLGVGMPRIRQLRVLAVEAASEADKAGVCPGDLLLSLNGQPPEGELQVIEGKLSSSPFVSWFKLLNEASGPELTLVVLHSGAQVPTQLALPWGAPHVARLRRANMLYLAQHIRSERGGFEKALQERDPGLMQTFRIVDPDAPLESHMERYYVEEYWWPEEFVKLAVANATARFPHFQRGLSLYAAEKYEQAIQEFQRELQVHPYYADSFRLIALCRFFAEQWDEAILAWSSFIALRPELAHSYLWRGYAHRHAGNLDLARTDFEKALEHDPQMKEAADALNELTQGD